MEVQLRIQARAELAGCMVTDATVRPVLHELLSIMDRVSACLVDASEATTRPLLQDSSILQYTHRDFYAMMAHDSGIDTIHSQVCGRINSRWGPLPSGWTIMDDPWKMIYGHEEQR